MRSKVAFLLAGILLLSTVPALAGSTSEDEFVNKYIKKLETKQTKKLAWVSGYFSFNRINRDNDYNKFAIYESDNFDNADISWLGDSKAFGIEMGMAFSKRFGWTIGAEYWMKLGEKLDGSFLYAPTGTTIENPESQLQVYGISTSVQYYFFNHPQVDGRLDKLALRVGGSIGFYQVKWDLWEEYQNLNLATAEPTGTNASFKDNAPGFSMILGADYPIKLFNLVMGIDMSYLYLNFDNVAWYNTSDEEIIASYSGDSDGRVDIGLSGVRGKIEIKRFFSW